MTKALNKNSSVLKDAAPVKSAERGKPGKINRKEGNWRFQARQVNTKKRRNYRVLVSSSLLLSNQRGVCRFFWKA
jgi:hypothetical protein